MLKLSIPFSLILFTSLAYANPWTESILYVGQNLTNCKVSVDSGAETDVTPTDVAGGQICYHDVSALAGTGNHTVVLRACNVWGCQPATGVPLSFGGTVPGVGQFLSLVDSKQTP